MPTKNWQVLLHVEAEAVPVSIVRQRHAQHQLGEQCLQPSVQQPLHAMQALSCHCFLARIPGSYQTGHILSASGHAANDSGPSKSHLRV